MKSRISCSNPAVNAEAVCPPTSRRCLSLWPPWATGRRPLRCPAERGSPAVSLTGQVNLAMRIRDISLRTANVRFCLENVHKRLHQQQLNRMQLLAAHAFDFLCDVGPFELGFVLHNSFVCLAERDRSSFRRLVLPPPFALTGSALNRHQHRLTRSLPSAPHRRDARRA